MKQLSLRRARISVAALALLGVSALSACGAGSDSGSGDPDTLVVGTTISLGLIDPFQMQYKTVQNNVFDPLVRVLPGGGEPEARLATEWTRTDDLTWEFTLREGVTFHDGSALTADDVVYSFTEPAATKALAAMVISNIAKVEAVDAGTVKITTHGPDPLLLNSVSQISIVPKALYSKVGPEGFAAEPVGTGPYTVGDFDPDSFVNLSAYDDFWGDKAKTENVELKYFSDGGSLSAALESGQVDVAHEMSPNALKTLDGNDDFVLSSGYSGNQNMLTFNSTEGPFADATVREAANLAIDAEALIDALTYGAGVLEDGQLPIKGINGYTDTIERPEHDPSKARTLLAEAGAEGAEVTIAGLSLYKPLLEAVAAQLAEVGFKPTVEAQETMVWLEQLREGSSADIFYKGVSDIGMNDADRALSQLARGANPMVEDDAWDALYAAQRTELDPEKRLEAIREASAYVYDKDYVLWTYGRPSVSATVDEVSGIDFSSGLMVLFDDAVKK